MQQGALSTRRQVPHQRELGGLSMSLGLLGRSLRDKGRPGSALLQRIEPLEIHGLGGRSAHLARSPSDTQADGRGRPDRLQRPQGRRRGGFHGAVSERGSAGIRVRPGNGIGGSRRPAQGHSGRVARSAGVQDRATGNLGSG